MREMPGAPWVLITSTECENHQVHGAFPDPEEASAYLESLGVVIKGTYIGGYLTPGWHKGETEWYAEIDDHGCAEYAEVIMVPWRPVVKESQDG